ncbi:probable aspartic proteinase GIP2 [Quercus lobata]|uniref:probable aspartic proteinase GIP2 n=1 Tax=Quercus lobata TaxID=97700 RepID=UPI001243F5B0|nr:probable aspartic proteinase GIP2 [Quercus lobata]
MGELYSGSLNGLARGTEGILGVRRTQIALPMQLANAFELERKFALCVPSSSQSGFGVMFFGDGLSYYMPPLAVIEDFVNKAASRKITRVESVAPFGACFSTKMASTKTGPAVPTIDLVQQSKSVYWRIYGANSMVKVKENVQCLGVVDGGSKLRASIVIGGHYQLVDNIYIRV